MTPEEIKALREKRMKQHNELIALLETARDGNRELTVDEQATEARINTELTESGQVVTLAEQRNTALTEAETRRTDSEAAFAALMSGADTRGMPGGAPVGGPDGAVDEQAQVRSWLTGQSGNRALEVRAGRPMGTEEFRVLSKLTAGAGGNTVKTSFYDQLVAHLIEVSGLMQTGPTVLNTSTGEQMLIPKTTGHSTAALVAEAGTIGASDPVFAQAPLDAYKYALLLQVSHELANDTSVNLLGYLAMQAGRAIGNAFGAQLITGTGSSQPQGVVPVATSAGITATTAIGGGLVPDNIIDLYYSVIAPYRNSQSASFLMRDSTVAAVRKFRDNSGGAGTGQYMWQPSLQVGTPDTLMGKKLITDPTVPAIALNARSVLFGDFSQYYVRMVESLRFERSDDFAFNTDLITYRCILRGDGELIDTTGAIKCFIGAAS
jgi:HK97 family phage major capsid protein